MGSIHRPLILKEIKGLNAWQERVMFFDVGILGQKVLVMNNHLRVQSPKIAKLFPTIEKGICACGCRKPLLGRQRRWASEDCSLFASRVAFILAGYGDTISFFMKKYHGWNCQKCGCEDKGKSYSNGLFVSDIKIDHIIPVKHGGGGCWLSNFQLLCHTCHVQKTNEDFNWKQKNKNQLKIFNP